MGIRLMGIGAACLSMLLASEGAPLNPLQGDWKSVFHHPFYSHAGLATLDPYLLKMRIRDSSIQIKQFSAPHSREPLYLTYDGNGRFMENVFWFWGKQCRKEDSVCREISILQVAILRKDSLFLNWGFGNDPFLITKPMLLVRSKPTEFEKPDSVWISE